jgi:hypothetical protein
MNQAFADKPASYRAAIAASLVLGASWLAYLAYLSAVTVTKQSVYMGPITFYAALLLAVSGLSVAVHVCTVAYLVRIRHQLAKRAAIWGLSALLVAVAIFAITRTIINGAT